MKKLLLSLTALATLASAVPAAAQPYHDGRDDHVGAYSDHRDWRHDDRRDWRHDDRRDWRREHWVRRHHLHRYVWIDRYGHRHVTWR